MIPLALGAALARVVHSTPNSPSQGSGLSQRPIGTGQAPQPQVPLSRPTPGPQAPVNPTGELPPRPKAPPPRIVDSKVPPPVTAPTQPSPNEVPTGPLTAREAARIALRLQPSILAQRGQVLVQQGLTIQEQANLLPQLGLSAGVYNTSVGTSAIGGNGGGTSGGSSGSTSGGGTSGGTGGSTSGGTTGGTSGGMSGGPTGTLATGNATGFPLSTSLTLSQLLFDFGMTRNLVRQDRALTEAASADLDRAALTAVDQVENTFYAVVNDARHVAVEEEDIINRQRQLALAQARLTSGLGVPNDVVIAATSKSQSVTTLIQYRDQQNQDRVNLLQQMGLNPLTPVDAAVEDEPPVTVNDPRDLIAVGVKRRPEVRSALKTVDAYQFGLSAAKATDLPRIVGSVGGGLGTLSSSGGPIERSLAFSIGLEFPIIDGGRRRGAITSATGQLTTAQANLRTAVLQVQADVTGAYLGLLSSEQRVVAADQAVTNAREGVRIAEGRYANGLGLFQDITTAEDQLNTALNSAVDARNALNLARVRLRYATGAIL